MPLPVTCSTCGKSFSISDDVFEQKIKGRVVTVKCKQCQSPIRVDGTKGLSEAKVGPAAPASAPKASLPSASTEANGPSVDASADVAKKDVHAEPAPHAPSPQTSEHDPAHSASQASDEPVATAQTQNQEAVSAATATPSAGVPEAQQEAPFASAGKASATSEPSTSADAPGFQETPEELASRKSAFEAVTATTDVKKVMSAAEKAPRSSETAAQSPKSPAVVPRAAGSGFSAASLGGAKSFKGPGSFTSAGRAANAAAPASAVAPSEAVLPVTPAEPVASLETAATPGVSALATTSPDVGTAPQPAPIGEAAALPGRELLFAVDLPDGDRELTDQQIAEGIARGEIGPTTLVWREGMPEWLELSKVTELAPHLEATKKKVEQKPAASVPQKLEPKPQVKAVARSETKATAPKTEAKPATPATKSQLVTPSAAARFRPRQPTIPMGMLPDALQAKPDALQAKPPAPSPPPPSTTTAAAESEISSAPPIAPPAPAPLPPPPPANLKETPRLGAIRAPVPIVPPASRQIPEEPQMVDDEPTVLRPSPFAELERTPAPRAPMPTPVRELLSRPDAARSSPWAAAAELVRAAPKPPSVAPSSPQAGPRAAMSPPLDTYRATPEAKRGWFPESPDLTQSSPFPVGAPKAPAPSSPLASSATSSALLGAATSAPVTAPVPSSAMTALNVEEPAFKPRRRALWIVLVIVALAAGVAVAVSISASSQAPAPAPTAEPHAAVPAAPTEAAPTPTAEPGATANENSASTNDASGTPASDDAPRNGGPLLPSGSPKPGSEAGFAQAFAQGAKQAASGGSLDRFDPAAAKSALDAQLQEAARCREAGGPTGITQIAVTFAPNGSATNAVISEPPFAGTSVGGCIGEAMKRARVKPFSGAPAVVNERISIR